MMESFRRLKISAEALDNFALGKKLVLIYELEIYRLLGEFVNHE
jgi:hypothetical protein